MKSIFSGKKADFRTFIVIITTLAAAAAFLWLVVKTISRFI